MSGVNKLLMARMRESADEFANVRIYIHTVQKCIGLLQRS